MFGTSYDCKIGSFALVYFPSLPAMAFMESSVQRFFRLTYLLVCL